jgi:hypothetical protein
VVASTAAPAKGYLSDYSSLADSPAAKISIDRYVASGERVRGLMDIAYKVCLGVVVLVAVAWAFGVLPGAVKLF